MGGRAGSPADRGSGTTRQAGGGGTLHETSYDGRPLYVELCNRLLRIHNQPNQIKTMSDTPRTDACEKIATRRHGYYDRFAIARELERELAETKGQRDTVVEAMHVIVDVARKNLDKPHPPIERVYAKALDSVKGAKP